MRGHAFGGQSGYGIWRFEPADRGTDTFTFPSDERLRQLANDALGTTTGGEDRLLEVGERYDNTLILHLRSPVKGKDVRDKLAPKIEEETVRNQ